jgi:hypothetical protein
VIISTTRAAIGMREVLVPKSAIADPRSFLNRIFLAFSETGHPGRGNGADMRSQEPIVAIPWKRGRCPVDIDLASVPVSTMIMAS